MSSKKKFNPPKGKIALPETKVASDYGKKKSSRYLVQAHDGLLIPEVKNLMKVPSKKLKQNNIFDVKGDGKKGPPTKTEGKGVDPSKKNFKGFVYSYKKRI